LGGRTGWSGLAEPGAQYDSCTHVRSPALIDDPLDSRSGNGNDGQVYMLRNGPDRRVTLKPGNGLGVRIDRVRAPGESSGMKGLEDLVPNTTL
jgi:hypothetical protein